MRRCVRCAPSALTRERSWHPPRRAHLPRALAVGPRSTCLSVKLQPNSRAPENIVDTAPPMLHRNAPALARGGDAADPIGTIDSPKCARKFTDVTAPERVQLSACPSPSRRTVEAPWLSTSLSRTSTNVPPRLCTLSCLAPTTIVVSPSSAASSFSHSASRTPKSPASLKRSVSAGNLTDERRRDAPRAE
jgi:hypothetical protein